MPNEPSKFNGDVIDLAVQIKELDLHRDTILTADTIGALDIALAALELSVDVLKCYVSDLKQRVGLEQQFIITEIN